MLYKHVKTGGLYDTIEEDATLEWSLEPAVVYLSLDTKKIWVRPKKEFFDGRFIEVRTMDHFDKRLHDLEAQRLEVRKEVKEFRSNCNHYFKSDTYSPPFCLICGTPR